MVRSDNETRQSHTHHIRMTNGGVTPIEGGFRINGTASITVNGVAAAFPNSPVEIEITGGAAVALSNFKVTFSGGGAGHFGDQPLDGVVTVLR